MEEDSQDVLAVNRARSNYSEKRLKEIVVQKKYGETRAQYLWRLLRLFIRKTIDAVSKSDLEERNISHGVANLRSMKVGSSIKSMCYNYYAKEIIALDTDNYLTFFRSDGRYISNFLAVDLLQDTSNKFVKYTIPNKIYDRILYCSKDKQYIGWKPGEKEINLFSSTFELLSVAKSFEPIDCLGYNSKTGDIVTCGANSEVTLWNFRYGAKHLIPRNTYKNCLSSNFKYNFITIEPSEAPTVRCYIASNISITVINAFDGTVISYKDELHIRQITAMIFYDPMKYLITASKEGSIKVWDQKWYLKMVFVGHNGSVTSLAIHPFASYIISSSLDKTIKIWSLDQQDIVEQVEVEEPVTHIITEKNNPKFLTYSSDTIKVWKLNHIYEMFTNIGQKISKISEIDHKKFPKRILAQRESGGFHLINPAVGNVLTSLILHLKTVIVDAVYSSCENLAIVYLDNGDLLKVDTRTNPCRIIQTNRNFPKTITKLMLYEYYSDGNFDLKDDDLDEFKYLNETSLVYKALRLKISKELSNIKLKGFDRTLIFAGCKDGSIATIRWDNLDIDYEIEERYMHNNREILQLIPNVKEDQIISAGLDLVIKIWRVYPYASETLGLLRTIFCAYPPQLCCILRDRLCVAFNDMKTLTHTIVFFNRYSNERYDHRPEDDHSERIVAISACDKMKLVATASIEGIIKIWNMDCKLLRLIKLKDKPHSLVFCSTKADLLVGIGNHLFKISHKSYLPKAILFKMVSMEFDELTKEEPIPYSNDVRQLLTPTSFQRLKSAHKNEYRSESETIKTVESENEESDNEVFDVEQKERFDGIQMLVERDNELRKLCQGDLIRKPRPLKKKLAKQAFENYMKLYFDNETKVKIEEPEFFFITELDLFPKAVLKAKNEEFDHKDPSAFFPPVAVAKYKKPYNYLVEDYKNRVARCRKTLAQEDDRDDNEDEMQTSSPKSRDRPLDEKFEEKSSESISNENNVVAAEPNKNTDEADTIQRKTNKDQGTQTGMDSNDSNSKKRKSVNLPAEINTGEKTSKANLEASRAKRAKSKSRASEGKPPSTISPILEDHHENENESPMNTNRKNTDEDSTLSLELVDKQITSSVVIPPIKFNSPVPKNRKMSDLAEKAPYFISGGFIPNSILVRILWPPSLLKEMTEKEKSFWKPKALSAEQLQQLSSMKPKSQPVEEDESLVEEIKIERINTPVKKMERMKTILMPDGDDGDAEDEEGEEKVKPPDEKVLLEKLNSMVLNITPPPPPTPPSAPAPVIPETPKIQRFTPAKDMMKEKLEKMRSLIIEKQKTRESLQEAAIQKQKEEEERIEKEKSELAARSLAEEEELTKEEPQETVVIIIPKIPTFILPFQDTEFFMRSFADVPVESLPKTEDIFILELLKKATEIITMEESVINEVQQIIDLIINLVKESLKYLKDKKQTEIIGNAVINLINKAEINVRESKQRDFLIKCLQLLYELGTPSRLVVCEWMYWYIEGTELIRRFIRGLFESAGISEYSLFFYQEMDSWETWKIEDTGASKRKQVKKMCSDWILKWIITFQMHIRDTYSRLKKGNLQGRVSNTGKSILKSGANPVTSESNRGLTVKFDLNHEKTTIQNVTAMEGINYFCEMQNDKNKPDRPFKDENESKNTVLVIPKFETNTVLIRLGESHTDAHRPKRTESDVVLPPLKLTARQKFGDIYSTSHINLPLKRVAPMPFRPSVDTLTYTDNTAILEELGMLNDNFGLLTLKTSQKYFQPHSTYPSENLFL